MHVHICSYVNLGKDKSAMCVLNGFCILEFISYCFTRGLIVIENNSIFIVFHVEVACVARRAPAPSLACLRYLIIDFLFRSLWMMESVDQWAHGLRMTSSVRLSTRFVSNVVTTAVDSSVCKMWWCWSSCSGDKRIAPSTRTLPPPRPPPPRSVSVLSLRGPHPGAPTISVLLLLLSSNSVVVT